MCLGAALESRIGKIVYAASNLKSGALGGVTDLLAHHWGHKPIIETGLRKSEAQKILKEAFAKLRK